MAKSKSSPSSSSIHPASQSKDRRPGYQLGPPIHLLLQLAMGDDGWWSHTDRPAPRSAPSLFPLPPPHLLPPWWGRGARERGFSRILLELLFPTAVNKILWSFPQVYTYFVADVPDWNNNVLQVIRNLLSKTLNPTPR
jgi:hypothetical protein